LKARGKGARFGKLLMLRGMIKFSSTLLKPTKAANDNHDGGSPNAGAGRRSPATPKNVRKQALSLLTVDAGAGRATRSQEPISNERRAPRSCVCIRSGHRAKGMALIGTGAVCVCPRPGKRTGRGGRRGGKTAGGWPEWGERKRGRGAEEKGRGGWRNQEKPKEDE